MYVFALMISLLMGFVCACGVWLGSGEKILPTLLSMAGFTFITFISLIS